MAPPTLSRADRAGVAVTPRRCRPGAHAPTVPTWRSRPDGADLALTPRRCRPGAHAPTVPTWRSRADSAGGGSSPFADAVEGAAGVEAVAQAVADQGKADGGQEDGGDGEGGVPTFVDRKS